MPGSTEDKTTFFGWSIRKPRSRFLALLLSTLSLNACADSEAMRLLRDATETSQCEISSKGRQEAIIPLTATAFSLPAADQAEVIELIARQMANDCSLDAPDSEGITAINVAVLKSEPLLLRQLLKMGADPEPAIVSERPWLNGLNSLEFAALIYERAPTPERGEVVRLLENAGREYAE
ncbi:MAG: hypothetical protein JKY26_02105 [Pseudomonas sp.]|nr:hypothetical protein [Pseudomonas sp.]